RPCASPKTPFRDSASLRQSDPAVPPTSLRLSELAESPAMNPPQSSLVFLASQRAVARAPGDAPFPRAPAPAEPQAQAEESPAAVSAQEVSALRPWSAAEQESAISAKASPVSIASAYLPARDSELSASNPSVHTAWSH